MHGPSRSHSTFAPAPPRTIAGANPLVQRRIFRQRAARSLCRGDPCAFVRGPWCRGDLGPVQEDHDALLPRHHRPDVQSHRLDRRRLTAFPGTRSRSGHGHTHPATPIPVGPRRASENASRRELLANPRQITAGVRTSARATDGAGSKTRTPRHPPGARLEPRRRSPGIALETPWGSCRYHEHRRCGAGPARDLRQHGRGPGDRSFRHAGDGCCLRRICKLLRGGLTHRISGGRRPYQQHAEPPTRGNPRIQS